MTITLFVAAAMCAVKPDMIYAGIIRKPGSSAVIEFAPTQPGEYEFYRAVPGHKEAGMVGRLIVAAP